MKQGNLETFRLDWLISRFCMETLLETFGKLVETCGNLKSTQTGTVSKFPCMGGKLGNFRKNWETQRKLCGN